MRKTFILPNEPWCVPKAPRRVPPAGRTDRWCFPDAPARVPPADPDEPWCFLGDAGRRQSGAVPSRLRSRRRSESRRASA
jgi:hypothetical protein